jgi:hypothetical protein
MSGSGSSRARSRLALEILEGRVLLAGDVAVFLNGGGNLILRGDNQANCVQVEQFGGPGTPFTILGCNDAAGMPTGINGVANGEVTFSVSGGGDMRISLRGGDDRLDFARAAAAIVATPGDLEIATGAGDDHVGFGGDTHVKIGGDLKIQTGKGKEFIIIANTEVAGDLAIKAGGCKDSVRIIDFASIYVNIGGDLKIQTGKGKGSITIAHTEVADDVAIKAGGGEDSVRIIDFSSVGDNLEITTGGSGADRVDLFSVRVGGGTKITTGAGADRVSIHDSLFAGTLRVKTGSENDYVQICASTFRRAVAVTMGSGNDDHMCVSGGSVFEDTDVVFDGGSGTADVRVIFASEFAGSPLLGDITPGFEFDFDDCSFFPEADGCCGF